MFFGFEFVEKKKHTNLREKYSDVCSEIEQIKKLHVYNDCTNEFIVGGIPSTCNLEPPEITRHIFSKLNVRNLVDKVCGYRTCKQKFESNAQSESLSYSYVIQFKSAYHYNAFLKARRKYGVLDFSDMFPNKSSKIISIYEMLNEYKYKLKLAAKSRAETHSYKYVWVNNNNVYARKHDTSKILTIVTEKDLNKIQ